MPRGLRFPIIECAILLSLVSDPARAAAEENGAAWTPDVYRGAAVVWTYRDFLEKKFGRENFRLRRGSRRYRIEPECWKALELARTKSSVAAGRDERAE